MQNIREFNVVCYNLLPLKLSFVSHFFFVLIVALSLPVCVCLPSDKYAAFLKSTDAAMPSIILCSQTAQTSESIA